jgi:RNA 2',3'-cyclic 3'-phosphodiesterase
VRLFVALTPPAAVVEELVAATAGLRAERPELRWTPPEQWHLTLAFLGEVDDRAREDLLSRLGRAASRHAALRLSFGSAGRFGDRVLWTRVRGDVEPLRRLAAAVQAAARRARLPVETRPYRPHLTLARTREPTDLRPDVEALGGFSGREWVAADLHLVRSHLGAGPGRGARHEHLATWPLTGG